MKVVRLVKFIRFITLIRLNKIVWVIRVIATETLIKVSVCRIFCGYTPIYLKLSLFVDWHI